MTNTGRSKRSRANRQRMQREYTDHWEDRLPTVDKQEPYKKLGLPLVLMPFVLMFCGGCVGSVPAASMLIVLFFSAIWFGERVVDSVKTESYWVVYRRQPTWLVGETKEAAATRRAATLSATEQQADRYPDDYAGRVQSIVPIVKPRPPWAVGHLACVQLPLTRAQLAGCRTRRLRVVDGALQPTAFADTYGAIADTLLATHTAAEVTAAIDGDDAVSRDTQSEIYSLMKTLPQTITHTGTGLYAVKVTPTNESEVQSGAVAGQVVTIVGTVAASPAFTGGYITNSTQAETRAIVSHTTNTATLEGDITAWGDGDTLEWYDSWSTVDAAADQVYTDQGATEYTSTQIVELYDGTYTEAVAWTTMNPVQQHPLVFRAAAGQTSVIVDGDGTTAFSGSGTDSTEYEGFTARGNGYGTYGVYHFASELRFFNMTFDDVGGVGQGRGINTNNYGYVEGCTFNLPDYALNGCKGYVKNCAFSGCSFAFVQVTGDFWWYVIGCTFDGCAKIIDVLGSQAYPPPSYRVLYIVNCTFYDGDEIFANRADENSRGLSLSFWNNIVHTYVTVFDADGAGGDLSYVNADYNTYYNCTQVAEIAGSDYTLAQWQGLTDARGNSPDANSVTTDPGLTSPATADFSLTAASNCRHAGVGSYASIKTGINAVAFDKWHPDKGAWSSGVGPNVSNSG